MKILVTGATGFVGACLARRLVQLGHEVHAVVRETSNLWRIADLAGDLQTHCCDLRNQDTVAALVGQVRPEAVCHLATYGGFSSQKESGTIFQTNFIGTMNLVHACEKTELSCFINTGSSSEYGLKDRPMKEDDLLEPLGDYGVTKAATTLFCRSEAIAKKLPMVTLRLFSPYGPWDDPKRLVPYVVSSLLQGRVPALSSPAFVRDYIYIEDVVDAYLAALQAVVNPGGIYNVGSGVQTSLGELVSCISELLPQPEPVWGKTDPQRVEPVCWVADKSRIASALGWGSSIALRHGLAKTVAWMREHSRFYGEFLE
jgi:nucleoside-diphosphate-sugar epimerase